MTSPCTNVRPPVGPLRSREPRFLMDGLYVRFNPADVETIAWHDVLDGETVIGNRLHLRGFTPDTGAIVNCSFVADENVEYGHVIIERMPPMPEEDSPSPWWKFWR